MALLMIPAILAAQTPRLREPRGKMLKQPKPGYVGIILTSGQKETGVIARVTPQSVFFENDAHPRSCEEISRSDIAEIRWMDRINPADVVEDMVGSALSAAFWTSFELAFVVTKPLRSQFPHKHPLSGTWESANSTLIFVASRVNGEITTLRHGRYSVGPGGLHLTVGNSPERVVPFQISCRELTLDNSPKLSSRTLPKQWAEPIMGEWANANLTLKFKPDGSYLETQTKRRSGTFDVSNGAVAIHWNNGEQWSGHIEHLHLLVRAGPTETKYRYAPPVPDWGY